MAQGHNQVDPSTGQPIYNVYEGAPTPYDNSKILAKHAYDQAVAALRNQRGETLDYYGLGRNGKPDPNNIYGAYNVQQRTQGQQLTDLSNAQVGAGLTGMWGGKGLAAGQRNQALFQQGMENKDMLSEFQSKMNAIRLGFIQAKQQRNDTETSGTLQAIINAITAGQFTPTAPRSA